MTLATSMAVVAENRRSACSATTEAINEHRRFLDRSVSGNDEAIEGLEVVVELTGGVLWIIHEVVAVRADRVALVRRVIQANDGSIVDGLVVSLFGSDLRPMSCVVFEVDDLEGATGLLHELHAAHPEPVQSGAHEAAIAYLEAFEEAVERANATDGCRGLTAFR